MLKNIFKLALLSLAIMLSLSVSALAVDMNGAWAGDASVCSKVFVKNNDRISFATNAELYGGGFIVEGNRASGTFQKCNIKSRRDDGTTIHLIAACSDGIMIQEMKFAVKVVGSDQITLTLAEPQSVENPFVRCRL
jgi:hypothetical protein